MKIFALLLGLVFVSAAGAQKPQFQVVSFFETSAYLTERFIPFGVRTFDGVNVEKIESVDVPKPCYSMIDPYRPHVFFIYCTEETEASFVITIRGDGSKIFKVPLPPIFVKQLALLSSTPKPDGPVKPIESAGKKLFLSKKCNQCHNSPYPLSKSETLATLKAAINSEDQMAKYKNQMSDQQLSDLVKFINEEL